MSQYEKIHKLIDRMEHLVNNLCERRDLVIHQHVNQFYYMQKAEELNMLLDQFDILHKSMDDLATRMHTNYATCAAQWRRDVRWLNTYNVQERWKSIL